MLAKRPRRGRFARAALRTKRTIPRGSFSARASVASSASTNHSTSSSERTSGERILITFESWPATCQDPVIAEQRHDDDHLVALHQRPRSLEQQLPHPSGPLG